MKLAILLCKSATTSPAFPTTGFGGHVDPTDATMRSAAARELGEETNLPFKADDLRYFKTYHKQPSIHGEDSYVTYYTLSGVSTNDLKVYEGQGFEVVSPNKNLDEALLSPLVRQVIKDYKKSHDKN